MERPTSKIVCVTKNGVLLDTLDPESVEVPCNHCKTHNEIVVYADNHEVTVYNTETEEKNIFPIPDTKRMEIAPNGTTIAIFTKDQKLNIISNTSIIHTAEKVSSFELSSEYAVYTQEAEEEQAPAPTPAPAPTQAQPSEASPEPEMKAKVDTVPEPTTTNPSTNPNTNPNIKKKPVPKVKIQKKEGVQNAPIRAIRPMKMKAFSILGGKEVDLGLSAPFTYTVVNKRLITTRIFGEVGGDIEVFNLESTQRIKKVGVHNLMSTSFFRDAKYSRDSVLCLCTVSGHTNTYYDAKILYQLHLTALTFSIVPVENPISDVVFLKKDTFAVCFGNSPSKITVFNGNLEKVKELKRGVRNKMFFNRQENIACLAGMNNLPGTIEIVEHPSNIFISSNEMVGCSIIDWSPCGRFYLAAVTNRMAIDNKVAVFDYYSRKIGERHFKELIDCKFLGADEPFKNLQSPPEKVKVEKKVAYVPPSLRTAVSEETSEWMPAHVIKHKERTKEKKSATLQKELEEIMAIEERMNKGEVVPGGFLKLQKKEGLLKKIEKHKTPK
ncbi:translation initiation factor 2A [Nematocida displodere]|uniref:Translation initiation factor 2A n=1 Tax=Nematocida displodere TaxID=1805483 RepID=A0A177EIG4_9MICR|nr:translation initiation factor 2A [Nematocida displodere]